MTADGSAPGGRGGAGRSTRRRPAPETATDRLSRILAMVPYISRRPGVSLADLAAEFGVTTAQVSDDLNLVMVCGLPGYYPDDLIDVVLDEDGGTVSIAYDAGIERPVRLTPDEAVALTVALRALADLPGLLDTEAVFSALAKLEQVVAGPVPAVSVTAAEPAPALQTVRDALAAGRRLWISYYTPSRDTVTQRTVDPVRLLVVDGHAYLEGYCHLAEDVRRFRLDRIDEARVLDEAATPADVLPTAPAVEVPTSAFTPHPAAPSVTLRLAPAAKWVSEYYLTDAVTELADPPGWVRATLPLERDDWVVRLVLSLGGAAVIEDRPDLADAVRRRAEAALAGYPAG